MQEKGFNYSHSLINSYKFILDFYFGQVPVDTILLMAGCSSDEFALHNIFDVSKEVGLYSDIYSSPVSKISRYMLPALLYDEKEKPVVLIQIDGSEATIFDGSSNAVAKIPLKELAKSFKQVLYFFRNKTDRELIDIEDKSRAWFYKPVKEAWRGYVEVAILSVFINVFVLAVPLYVMSVYDRVVPNFATSTLKVLAIGVVMILVFDIIFKSVRNYIVENIGKNISNRLEEELLKKMLTVQMKYDDMLMGAKVNLFRELGHIRELFASRTMINIMDFPFFLLLLLIIYIISPAIALIPMIGAVVIIALNIIMQIPIQSIRRENYKNVESKNSFLVETIHGNESIRLTNATAKKLFEWRQLIAFTNQLSLRMQMLNTFAMNSSYLIIQVIVLLVVFVGVFEIHNKNLSIGGLIAISILSSRVMVPIVNLSSILIKYKEFKEALNSLNRFWYLPQENSESIELGIGALKGKIEFDKVDYYYKKSKTPAIKNFSLKIEHGEKVAIIGQTGAGKSTLLRLLTGLETPTSGKIHIDGHDIETLHNVEIRKNIGVMPQEPFLFSGTLKENIELSRNISKERLNEVINLTGLAGLVKKGGMGENLQVGERGNNLSVGQRHLVALARTILQDPPILILDEPTTGLDIGLEKELTRHIKKIAQEKTLILITHRMAALELVDRVVVIKDGQVAVNGPRDKVMEYLKNPEQGAKQ